MGSYCHQLVHVIEKLRLDRFPEGQWVMQQIQCRPVSEDEARRYLIWLTPLINQQLQNPNLLEPPPDAQTMYAEGYPNVTVGEIESGLRFGFRLEDGPRSVFIAGDTGSGKTTLIRRIITMIEEWNHEEENLTDRS